MKKKYDICGWATRAGLRCSDGRTIMPDAFKDDDGLTVPLVWNHCYASPDNVLGHALLQNRGKDGVYAYAEFNDTDTGQRAKLLCQHGDITSFSICANELQQNQNGFVTHGRIREVSLVLAGANPGASIDTVMTHGANVEEKTIIYTAEEDAELELFHADNSTKAEEPKDDGKKDDAKSGDDETIQDVIDSMSEKQKNVLYYVVGKAVEDANGEDDDEEEDDDEGGNDDMKHNIFDQGTDPKNDTLTHSDQGEILQLAQQSYCGSFQNALRMYADSQNQAGNDTLKHAFDSDDLDSLFPEYQLTKPGAPEMLTADQSWVSFVINGVKKSPISRIRTRQMNIKAADLRASGYIKGKKKTELPTYSLISRTTDPQTIYVKDSLHRDDIIDITDFDAVAYIREVMKMVLYEELATAILIGDSREDGDEAKIKEEHIRSIWHDDELYTIHYDVDIEGMKTELQGTNTSANFGENYIYAEAIVAASLYSRENYKGSGNLAFICTPHLLNVMLLAKDMNGRRIYSSKNDLAAALNVSSIHTMEQMEGKTRTYTPTGESTAVTKKLLGLFVNLSDYQLGATKGGQITNFEDFDIDYNQQKYLMETRVSGALTKVYSAIALEEDVTGNA